MSLENFDERYDYTSIQDLNGTSSIPVTTQPGRENRHHNNNIQNNTEEYNLNSLDPDNYPGIRRPIPVSTIDWQSTNQSQFIPINGLDFLIGINSLIIQQTMEISDMGSTIEPENKYILKVPNGETLYMATEFSTPLHRLIYGSNRSFNMTLMDHSRQQALCLTRKTGFSCCCFPCIRQDIEITVPPGEFLGSVQQEWTLMVPLFLVKNFNDDVLYVIEGPKQNYCCPSMEAEFRILSADTLTQHGSIIHGWDIESTNYNMAISFPPMAADPKIKALLIGAAFLIEYVYFVSAKSTKFLRCC